MRILHVVTWIGPGNPFGGPVAVVRNLSAELEPRGHDVIVIAGAPSSAAASTNVEQPRQRLFRGFRIVPGAGFSGLLSPGLLWWALRNIRKFDVVHVHVCRDLITMPTAFIASLLGIPVILQPHGMIDASRRVDAHALDAVLTRRVFRRATAVIALTSAEATDMAATVGLDSNKISVLGNGVPEFEQGTEPPNEQPDILFCSRLQRRKRPTLFVMAAIELVRSGAHATFSVVGSDEGEGETVDRLIANSGLAALRREGPLEVSDALRRIRGCDVLVLPAVDEPFGMVVVEAMSFGKPVIVTDSCGLAEFVERHDAGLVVASDSVAELTAALAELIADPLRREEMGRNGRRAVRSEFTIERVVDRLVGIYEDAVD